VKSLPAIGELFVSIVLFLTPPPAASEEEDRGKLRSSGI
jgi:hypothetical protein